MGATAGIVCHKNGFGWTVVDGDSVSDTELDAPAHLADRGEVLSWLLIEAERLLASLDVASVNVQQPGGGQFGGAAPERFEVEAVVQVAAHRAGLATKRMTTDGVRAAFGIPRTAGAYKGLMARADVKARGNDPRRHQYLLALAAAR